MTEVVSSPAAGRLRGPPDLGGSADLFPSKTTIPVLRHGVVARPGRVDRLVDSRSRIVSVAAPGGHGKTTVLAQWAYGDPTPFAWLTVDEHDDDPVSLVRYVVAALARAGLADATRVSKPRTGATWSTVVPALCGALAGQESPFVLVLDDLHTINSTESLDVVATFAREIPPGARIVLSGRTTPTALLAAARPGGELLEVGPQDLALTDEEAAELFGAEAVPLTPEDVAELNRRTEGWPAGLYLAGLAVAPDGTRPQ